MKSLNFKEIGQKVKERRNALGFTQDFVATQLDVNPSHISNIECGRVNPSLTALIHLANVLKCSVDYFISDEYTYKIDEESAQAIDARILEKLKHYDSKKKETLLQILDLL